MSPGLIGHHLYQHYKRLYVEVIGMYCAFQVAGSLKFWRFFPRPCSGSGSTPSSRGGAGSGAGFRLDPAACAVGFGEFWPQSSSLVLGLLGWI